MKIRSRETRLEGHPFHSISSSSLDSSIFWYASSYMPFLGARECNITSIKLFSPVNSSGSLSILTFLCADRSTEQVKFYLEDTLLSLLPLRENDVCHCIAFCLNPFVVLDVLSDFHGQRVVRSLWFPPDSLPCIIIIPRFFSAFSLAVFFAGFFLPSSLLDYSLSLTLCLAVPLNQKLAFNWTRDRERVKAA